MPGSPRFTNGNGAFLRASKIGLAEGLATGVEILEDPAGTGIVRKAQRVMEKLPHQGNDVIEGVYSGDDNMGRLVP